MNGVAQIQLGSFLLVYVLLLLVLAVTLSGLFGKAAIKKV